MTVNVDRALVDHIALLSRLRLGPEESAAMADHLRRIVEMADRLAEVDAPDVSPFAVAVDDPVAFRADAAAPSLPADAATRNGPEREPAGEGGYAFRVPPVLE